MNVVKVKLDAVVVTERSREGLGDIKALAKNIEQNGLLQAIAVEPADSDGRHRLLFGQRRLEAFKSLKRPEIDAIIINTEGEAQEYVRLELERSENQERKALTIAEASALKQRLEPFFKKLAEQRIHAGVQAEPSEKGNARDKASAGTGYDAKTLKKFQRIEEAVQKKPECAKRKELLADAKKTNKVNKPFNELLTLEKQEEALEARNRLTASAKDELDKAYPVLEGNNRNFLFHKDDPEKFPSSIKGIKFCLTDPEWENLENYEWLACVLADNLAKDGVAVIMLPGVDWIKATAMVNDHLHIFSHISYLIPGASPMVHHPFKLAPQAKLCLVCKRNDGKYPKQVISNVVKSSESGRGDWEHPHRLDVGAVQEIVEMFSKPNDLCIDPFAGSGSLAEACMRSGRRCISIESKPERCEMIRARIAKTHQELVEAKLNAVVELVEGKLEGAERVEGSAEEIANGTVRTVEAIVDEAIVEASTKPAPADASADSNIVQMPAQSAQEHQQVA